MYTHMQLATPVSPFQCWDWSIIYLQYFLPLYYNIEWWGEFWVNNSIAVSLLGKTQNIIFMGMKYCALNYGTICLTVPVTFYCRLTKTYNEQNMISINSLYYQSPWKWISHCYESERHNLQGHSSLTPVYIYSHLMTFGVLGNESAMNH